MNDNFDPYWEWLWIPSDRRPPTHYDLLGLPEFETSPERIRAAATQRTAAVLRYRLGDRAGDSQRLQSELSQALNSLGDPTQKQRYDARLRQQAAAKAIPDAAVMPPLAAIGVSHETAPAAAKTVLAPMPIAAPQSSMVSGHGGPSSKAWRGGGSFQPQWQRVVARGSAAAFIVVMVALVARMRHVRPQIAAVEVKSGPAGAGNAGGASGPQVRPPLAPARGPTGDHGDKPAPAARPSDAAKPLSPPTMKDKELRKEPKFFPLEELLGFAGYGGIAINEEGGAQRMNRFGSGGMGMDGMSPGSDGMMSGPGRMMSGSDGMMSGPGGMMPGSSGMSSGSSGMGGPDGMMGGPGGMMSGPGGMMSGPGGMMGPGGMSGKGGAKGRAQAERERKKLEAQKKKEVAPVVRRPKPQSTEKIVISQPPSGAHVEGRYWVCLVGAVPYWKQLGDYQDAFRDSRFYDVKRDYPRYSLPIIERAEINAGKQDEWETLNVEAALEDFTKWAVEYPEVADPRFINPDLTWPLPPLVFANHDKQKVNHPRTQVVEKKTADTDSGPKKKAKPRSLSAAAGRSKGGGQRGMSGSGSSGGMTPGSFGGADPYGGMGGSGMSGPSMGGQGMYGPGKGGAAGRRAGPVVEHRLFRFFDFDVEPGKTYRYRIKLVLSNPNAGVPPRFLESYDFGKGATREADWSPPSPEVTVIAGNRLLAGNVIAGRTEPSGTILAKRFDMTEAAEIRKVFDVNRGSVLNQREVEVGLPDSGNTKGTRSATVDFETNAVVLDLFGGEKLPGVRSSPGGVTAKVPGHILVLDNDGEIKVLLQADDAGVFETEAEEAKNQLPPDKKEDAQKAAGAVNTDGFNNFDALDTGKKKRGR